LLARNETPSRFSRKAHVVKGARDGAVEILKEVADNIGVVDVFLALVDGGKRSSYWCCRSSRLRIGGSHGHTVGSAVRGTVRCAERGTERSTARRAGRSILDLACTSDALVGKRLVELRLHVTSSTRHADINASLSSIASIDTVCYSVAGNVDRLQVTTSIVDATFDNESGSTLSNKDVAVGLWAGRASGGRLDRRACRRSNRVRSAGACADGFGIAQCK